MTALERINQLKREGKNESEIIATLRAEGVNPMQISDALNQSKIKEAIVDPNPTEGMMPSMMETDENELPKAQTQQLSTQQPAYEDNNYYTPKQPQPQYAPTPQYQQQMYQQYPQSYQQYPPSNEEQSADYSADEYQGQNEYSDFSSSTDTIIEIAEQVFAEKIKKISKELEALNEFKTIYEVKVENINERLKRMEKSFDKMQLDILDKVGEYGKGLDYIKKELDMVQDNFGKVIKNS